MTGWTTPALALAEDIREPGFACAALNASAWCARVDPAATSGLVGAALALTSGDAGPQLWAPAPPCPDDRTLLGQAAELEGHLAGRLQVASQMAQECRAALASAQAAAASVRAAANSAPTGQARAATEAALAAAQAAIADCEVALEIIDEAGTRLAHALNCLRRVPDDLASTYEVPYQHVADGGTLPFDGEFLLGGVSYEAA